MLIVKCAPYLRDVARWAQEEVALHPSTVPPMTADQLAALGPITRARLLFASCGHCRLPMEDTAATGNALRAWACLLDNADNE